MWTRRDSGQSTPEYAGLILLIAAIIVALVSLGIGRTVADGIERAICQIFHVGDDGVACGGMRGDEPEMTPLERATSGTYVALGDSYSSGEGGSEFKPGTDSDAKSRLGR